MALCAFVASPYAQNIDFCGVFPPHTATSSHPDSIYFDRFGNSYDLYEPVALPQAAPLACTAGYYTLVFFDVDAGLQDVFCKVFEDLSGLIAQRTNMAGCEEEVMPSNVRIEIRSMVLGNSATAMSASPYYYAPFANACLYYQVVSNLVENKINGSERLHPIFNNRYDGRILVNSGFGYTFHTDWNSAPASNTVDAYSVILHEALHLLGFASLLALDGSGENIGFTTWDHQLYTTPFYNPAGGSADVEPLLISDCEVNCWELNTAVFADMPEALDAVVNNCSSGGDFDFVFGDDAIVPIAGRDNDDPPGSDNELRNLMSHLNGTCNSQNLAYVMLPGIGTGPGSQRRTITAPELQVLCRLGYAVYDVCDGCYVIAHREYGKGFESIQSCCVSFFTGCAGELVELALEDLLCNDFSNDDFEITDAWGSGATLNATAISFTPATTGLFTINYTVKGCDCLLRNTFIEVHVGPCTDCEEIDPCANLVCVEDFEEYDPGNGNLAIHMETAGTYWVANGDNSLDICSDGAGNNYLFIGSHPSNREGLAMALSETLSMGCTLHVTFDASSRQPNVFSWYVSEYPPCPVEVSYVSFECQPTDCGSHVYRPFCIRDVPVNSLSGNPSGGSFMCTNSPNLETYTFSWLNNLGDFNYLILFPGPSGNGNHFNYIDNIIVTKDCLDACFTYELTDECLDVDFSLCSDDSGADHDWDFGDSGTSDLAEPSHEYSSPGVYTVTHTVTDACGNSETVVHEIVTGDCCGNYTVTTNTTWTSMNQVPSSGIFNTLTVQYGVLLTIGPDVVLKFCPGGKLVVEDGAGVQHNGTLTSLGDMSWQGVYVTGVPTAVQIPKCLLYPTAHGCVAQGSFNALEGSLIENAEIGIRNFGLAYSTRGGKISGKGATFLNNGVAVRFDPYESFSGTGQPQGYLAAFTECDFVVNSGYTIDEPFTTFVRLDGVWGVSFYGCTFENVLLLPFAHTFEDYGKGIHATHAGFYVGVSLSPPDPPQPWPPSPCLPGDCDMGIKSSFYGLAHGVYVESVTRVRPFSIHQSEFGNCYRGITSDRTSGGSILFNEFSLGKLPDISLSDQIGLYLALEHAIFEIQENKFMYASEDDIKAIGIVCNNIGTADNVIRRNYFEGLWNAHQAFGRNGILQEWNVSGLYYLCETVVSTPEDGFDILIPDTRTIDNIRWYQGELTGEPVSWILPAGNEFAYTGTDIHSDNAGSGDAEELFFYFYKDAGNQEPLTSGIGYFNVEREDENDCAQAFCAPPCLTPIQISDLKGDYSDFTDSRGGAIADYLYAIGQEDTITANEKMIEAAFFNGRAFKAASDIVTHAWFDTTGFHADTLIKWYGRLGTHGGRLMIAGELAWYYGINNALDYLDSLYLYSDLTDDEEEDVVNVIAIYSILKTTEIPDLSTADRNVIRSIAQAEKGTASGIARAVLSYHGENHPLPYYLSRTGGPPVRYRSDKKEEPGKGKQVSVLDIRPNPASDFVTVTWLFSGVPAEEEPGLLKVFDLYGRQVAAESIQPGTPVRVDVSGWSAGVYIAVLPDRSGKSLARRFTVH